MFHVNGNYLVVAHFHGTKILKSHSFMCEVATVVTMEVALIYTYILPENCLKLICLNRTCSAILSNYIVHVYVIIL